MPRAGATPLTRTTAVALACVLAAILAPPLVAYADTDNLPGRQVWAHHIGHGLPDELYSGDSSAYGANRPIDLQPPGTTEPTGAARQIPQAIAAGVTGMQVLIFDGENSGTDFVDQWLAEADATWSEGGARFTVAPCILPKTYAGTLQMMREYIAYAQDRPSAARIDGELVIYIYAGRELPVESWIQMQDVLAAEGTPVSLVGDLGTEASQHNNEINDESKRYINAFDATWLFDDRGLIVFEPFAELMRAEAKPFAGGLMPGYNRETADGYEDATGTQALREAWEQHLGSSAEWVNIVTWSDFVENTEIRPTSDWNITRSDINAFYSAKFRSQPFPVPTAESYVTTPKFAHVGGQVDAEGLVLNGGSIPVNTSVRLVDAFGNQLSEPVVTRVDPGEAKAVRSSSAAEPALTAGSVIYALVQMSDLDNNLLQSTVSAPISIYDKDERPTEPLRRTYYSIPARKALPDPVQLTVSGHSGPDTKINSTITTPGQVHTLELLQNTRLASLEFDTNRSQVVGPMPPGSIVGGQEITAAARGYYVARAIDSEGRVGYSPVRYVP